MTILSTAPQLRLDGLILSTVSHGLDSIDGLDYIAPDEDTDLAVAGQIGTEETWNDPARSVTRTFNVWITPYDADGNIVHAGGGQAHLRENIDTLNAILAKRGNPIAVELDVRLPAGGVETRTANGKVVDATPIAGTRLRRARVRIKFPFPYWNVTPQITGATPGVINPGGGAPVHDIVATFSAAGFLQHDGTGRRIDTTGACVVDMRARTITQGGNPARNLATFSHPDWFWMLAATNNTISGSNVTFDYYPARP